MSFNKILLIILFFSCFAAAQETVTAASGGDSEEDVKEIQYKSIGFSDENRPEVVKVRKKYLTYHRKWIYKILDDAEPYRIYVRNEIEKRNMPAILEYIPLIESNYYPYAVSKAGAAGMWQFMLNSIKPFLNYSDYVDERFDPWISTHAALSKLQDNYNMFGDWLIAITAYNCGAGAMRKALKKSEKKDFWSLRSQNLLSSQAAQYIPKLLAVAGIAENAEYYGIKLPTARNNKGVTLQTRAGEFDYITVKSSISINRLASELRMDYDYLYLLNPALIKAVTPPNEEYRIRLPEGMAKSAEYALVYMKVFPVSSSEISNSAAGIQF